ncbi:MAG: leucyl aminopeptidase [Gammaproteobacteria bacterium RIFCSPHIGHO2_12_FULL_35_23]|nr:MAG: leucyl aminopeptidase [Gammaproteobacteria bacterium RIFCSPHIGHO2_12_FULL_35_23]
MQITTIISDFTQLKTDCLIIGLSESLILDKIGQSLDKACGDKIKAALELGDFNGKLGESLTLTSLKELAIKRLLIIGTGNDKNRGALQYRKVLTTAYNLLLKTKTTQAVSTLHLISVNHHDVSWCIKESILSLFDSTYQFDQFKSKPANKYSLNKFQLAFANKKEANEAGTTINYAKPIAEGIKLTKDLANTPPNICNPSYLAEQAQALAKQYSTLTVEIIDEKEAKKMGMGAFTAVTQGSDNAGKIIILQYKGTNSKSEPIALVGKGITYDTGGYSLKDPVPMTDMKYDMCGAATVLGVLQACAEIKLPLNIIGIIAAAENMINGQASRNSDIVTSLSGQTIEITNTDAEGRLVLCDALTYVKKYNPKKVITVATLTGAAIIALGFETTALLANNQVLAEELLAAGNEAEDKAWQLPLFEEYHEYLKSEFADFINASLSRAAGTITAAYFLSNFTKDYHWAHLDIAGSSLVTGRQAKASGRPIPLLMTYLLNQVKSQS